MTTPDLTPRARIDRDLATAAARLRATGDPTAADAADEIRVALGDRRGAIRVAALRGVAALAATLDAIGRDGLADSLRRAAGDLALARLTRIQRLDKGHSGPPFSRDEEIVADILRHETGEQAAPATDRTSLTALAIRLAALRLNGADLRDYADARRAEMLADGIDPDEGIEIRIRDGITGEWRDARPGSLEAYETRDEIDARAGDARTGLARLAEAIGGSLREAADLALRGRGDAARVG